MIYFEVLFDHIYHKSAQCAEKRQTYFGAHEKSMNDRCESSEVFYLRAGQVQHRQCPASMPPPMN